MNKKTRKKKNRMKGVVIVVQEVVAFREEDSKRIHELLEQQMKSSSVIELPATVKLAAIIRRPGSRPIEIRQEVKKVEEGQQRELENHRNNHFSLPTKKKRI